MKKYIQIIIILALTIIVAVSAFLLPKNNKDYSKEGFYFDTYISIKVYSAKDSKQLDECLKLCERYEKLLSRTLEGSDIYRINNSCGKPVEVDPETYYLLKRALGFCEETNGKVDITIAPLVDEWGFSDKTYSQTEKPDDETINKLVENIDYKNIELSENNIVKLKNPDAKIDLGFIAKGYIADKLKEYLISQDVKSAVISLGGNVLVIGNKPDGSPFAVGIKDPVNTEDISSVIYATDESVVTSGTYERFVEYGGIRYHHILDTETGYPVNNDVLSVTIESQSSLEGDALSTICLILGEEESKNILKKYNAKANFIYEE
ncbi:MAG: FAD:protein FMN transferase [Lachnospiraceae bacterium]|nr:FAD:protein FMN transferase [Lachnospiraceae bacterium]